MDEFSPTSYTVKVVLCSSHWWIFTHCIHVVSDPLIKYGWIFTHKSMYRKKVSKISIKIKSGFGLFSSVIVCHCVSLSIPIQSFCGEWRCPSQQGGWASRTAPSSLLHEYKSKLTVDGLTYPDPSTFEEGWESGKTGRCQWPSIYIYIYIYIWACDKRCSCLTCVCLYTPIYLRLTTVTRNCGCFYSVCTDE